MKTSRARKKTSLQEPVNWSSRKSCTKKNKRKWSRKLPKRPSNCNKILSNERMRKKSFRLKNVKLKRSKKRSVDSRNFWLKKKSYLKKKRWIWKDMKNSLNSSNQSLRTNLETKRDSKISRTYKRDLKVWKTKTNNLFKERLPLTRRWKRQELGRRTS